MRKKNIGNHQQELRATQQRRYNVTRCYNVIFLHLIKYVLNDTQKESKELRKKEIS